MDFKHLLIGFGIALVAIWASNHVKFISNIVG
jgi:hypothetical protein